MSKVPLTNRLFRFLNISILSYSLYLLSPLCPAGRVGFHSFFSYNLSPEKSFFRVFIASNGMVDIDVGE